MYEFNWAFIGSGHIARKVAKSITGEDSGVKHNIISIYSRNTESAKIIAEKYNAKLCFSFEEAINFDNVDCVYIATPHSTHYEFIKKCIMNEKPVLCEKTITMNSAQLKNLIKLAKEKNIYFSSIMSYRFGKVYDEVKKFIINKTLGNLVKVDIEFGIDATKLPKRVRLFNSDCGGALIEMGIYSVSFLNSIFNNVELKKVIAKKTLNGIDLEEVISLNAKGINCTVKNSLVNVLSAECILLFENGKITLPHFYRCCSYKMETLDNEKNITFDFFYKNQFDETVIELKKGCLESQHYTFDSMIRDMEMMDSIRKEIGIIYPINIEKC